MIETIAGWLSHDVALWGGLYSPLLSWIGAGALIVFAWWQGMRLYSDVRAARALCADIDDALAALLEERRATHRDPLAAHHHTFRSQPLEQHTSRDSDDLAILDRLMALDPAMAQAWSQYRKTLVLEEVAWFQEPRIFSTRHAEECFTFERLFARRIHYAWYNHVPAFVTGISLLLTFVALLMGLSHLHADAQGIQGLQGLINGLAGKFLTSIVGLFCANIFSLIEKRVTVRLVTAHQELVDSLEGLFPRKMLEQWFEDQHGASRTMKDKARSVERPDLEGSIHTLGLMIQDLAMAMKTQTLALQIASDAGDGALKHVPPVSHDRRGPFAAIHGHSGRQ